MRRQQVGTVVVHRREVGNGVTLCHIAEPAVNARFDHQVDVWVGYQLQLDLSHLQCELQYHTGETVEVQAVESVCTDHGAAEGLEHVGEKNVET